jgi:hypothetical protein
VSAAYEDFDLIPATDDMAPPDEEFDAPPATVHALHSVPQGADDRSPQTPRPVCRVDSPAQAAEWLRTEVGRSALAGVFRRGAELVHCPLVGQDSYREPADGHDGAAQVRPLVPTSLASRIQWSYAVYKVMEDAQGRKIPVDTMFPKDAARVAVEAIDMLPHVQRLRGVIHSPIVRADGSILSAPGYDPATGLLYLPDPAFKVAPVPERPTAEQVAGAVASVTAIRPRSRRKCASTSPQARIT